MSGPPRAPLGPTNVFHISFTTMGDSGYLKSVKVTIEEDVMESMDAVRIDLAEHPLYKDLQAYVRSNPR